jgi:alpha-glucosidase
MRDCECSCLSISWLEVYSCVPAPVNKLTRLSPPVRAMFYEFDNPRYYSVDSQFFVGSALLITPVLQPNASTATGYFPTMNDTTWVDFSTHSRLDTRDGDEQTLDLPLGKIGVHVRSGSVLLMHEKAGYTLKETRDGGWAVLVVLDGKGEAAGTGIVDDGISLPGMCL